MTIGTVKFFNADKGYGFIAPESGGEDAFVHITAVQQAGMSTLDKDQRVSYELETDRRGKTSAVNLQSAYGSWLRRRHEPPAQRSCLKVTDRISKELRHVRRHFAPFPHQQG
jgi:CspA family cold shock protein